MPPTIEAFKTPLMHLLSCFILWHYEICKFIKSIGFCNVIRGFFYMDGAFIQARPLYSSVDIFISAHYLEKK